MSVLILAGSKACEYDYCLTRSKSDEPDYQILKRIESVIKVETSGSPNLIINNIPHVDLLNAVIYIFSCLGTWFGFVIISFNPINIYKRLKSGETEIQISKRGLHAMIDKRIRRLTQVGRN